MEHESVCSRAADGNLRYQVGAIGP